MKGSIFRVWPIIFITIYVIGSCAKQNIPAGGPKDILPPKIVKSVPPNSSVNFKGKSIIVTFDEFFTLDKINEKFMISPPMKAKPVISVRGKSLIIEFREERKDSTTYTLYFQDAIRDLDEANPLNNFQFVFSTGKVIDSLSVTGNVLDAFNLEPEKSTLVLMYRNLADSAPRKTLPDYITQSEENGWFRINNIKEGKYKIYALQDNNNDKKYDLADEKFAFIDSVLDVNPARNYLPVPKEVPDTTKIAKKTPAGKRNKELTDTLAIKAKAAAVKPYVEGEHKLYMYTAEKKARYLTSSGRRLPYQLIYTLSLPPDTSKFEFSIEDPGEKNYFIEKNRTQDTITIWLRDSSLYSKPLIKTIIRYPFTDSSGIVIYKRDSVPMRFITTRTSKVREEKNKYKFTTNIQNNFLKPGQPIIFSSPTPFRQPDTSRIKLFEKAANANEHILYTLIKDSLNSRRYHMNAKLKESGKYTLITDLSAFGNIFGERSDSSGINFSVRTADSYGLLTLDISKAEGDIIIQLLDTKENLIEEKKLRSVQSVVFPLLERGKYRIRAIYDLNHDGKWTTGDYDKKRQPEPVSFYPDEIEVKINWEIQQPWDIGIRNFKNHNMGTGIVPAK
jgi:uncharacterized protein (DUF2141 family)